jgi:hypothetical protein
MTATNTATKFDAARALGREIMAWDREDVRALKGMLDSLADHCREELGDNSKADVFYDVTDLASEAFPDGFDTEGHYALDKRGYALVPGPGNETWAIAPLRAA